MIYAADVRTDELIRITLLGKQIGVTYISPVNDPGLTSWQAGNWVVRLNVDPADTDASIKWDGTCIFVVDSLEPQIKLL